MIVNNLKTMNCSYPLTLSFQISYILRKLYFCSVWFVRNLTDAFIMFILSSWITLIFSSVLFSSLLYLFISCTLLIVGWDYLSYIFHFLASLIYHIRFFPFSLGLGFSSSSSSSSPSSSVNIIFVIFSAIWVYFGSFWCGLFCHELLCSSHSFSRYFYDKYFVVLKTNTKH